MRYLGRLTDWHDDKGYGFVVPKGGGDRAFVHIKAFEQQGRRPASGDLIAYAVQRDSKGRLNAVGIRFAGAQATRERQAPRRGPRKAIASVALAAIVVGWLSRKLPFEVFAVYVLMSGIALFVYAFDKSAAERGGWRTKERTLHAVALLGGWPGALLAQDLFRHKSRKATFQWVFWCTVLLNCGSLAWWLHATSH